jgi:outer membrane lipoprotein-sorting protein
MLQGQHMNLIAEDGNLYPYPREQYVAMLAAGKTRDAILVPTTDGSYPIYDRRLRLTNNTATGGGMLSYLSVAAATPGPTATDDVASTDEDVPAIIDVAANDTAAIPAVIDPSSVAISTPALNGVAVSNGDGSVTYTPNADFNGADSFTYTIHDDAGRISNEATVALTVNAVNDAPVAGDDAYNTTPDTVLNVVAPGLLANDTDVDGGALTAVLSTDPGNGSVVLNTNGSFNYTPNSGFTGTDSFTYTASDGVLSSATATVTITVGAIVNQPPVANDDHTTTPQNVAVIINVVGNDTDVDGTVDPATVTITTPPRKGTAVSNGDGTVTYTPNLNRRGSDAFGYTINDDLGATSNEATVRVDITR